MLAVVHSIGGNRPQLATARIKCRPKTGLRKNTNMSRNKEYDAELATLRTLIENEFAPPRIYKNTVKTDDENRTQLVLCSAALCDKMQATYESKDADYSSDGKAMGNLRMSEEIGVPAWQGVLIRMGDKKRRVDSFARRGTYAVASEKIEDTLLDLANYALLEIVLFDETTIGLFDSDSKSHKYIYDKNKFKTCVREIAISSVICSVLLINDIGCHQEWDKSEWYGRFGAAWEFVADASRNCRFFGREEI